MCPPPTRRRFLAGLGGAAGLGTVGATGYHAYTGPVDLRVLNSLRSAVELTVRLRRDGRVVHGATYDVPARTLPEYDEDSSAEIPEAERPGSSGEVRDRLVESATRGTTYEFDAFTDEYGLEAGSETVTVTCTGYVASSEGPLTDELLLFIPIRPAERGMYLVKNDCLRLYDPD